MRRLIRPYLFVYFTGIMGLLLVPGCIDKPEVPVSGKFIDLRDQHEYKWVKVGTQTWMAENLAYLPAVTSPANESDTARLYYVFRYLGSNLADAKAWEYYADYGVFYNWPAALDGADSSNLTPSGIKGACPEGWHLPSDGEWSILIDYLGGELEAGLRLKSTDGWNRFEGVSGGGDNSSGFNALSVGARQNAGDFYNLGYHALFWSATGFDKNSAWYRHLGYFHSGVYRYFANKRYGFSIRCVRN